jgi:hypothetical protein
MHAGMNSVEGVRALADPSRTDSTLEPEAHLEPAEPIVEYIDAAQTGPIDRSAAPRSISRARSITDQFEWPCRIIRVVRTEVGFVVTGESRIDRQSAPVCWQMGSFPAESGDHAAAETEANRAAIAFGHHIPPWFRGSAYVVGSHGEVTTFSPPAAE